MFIKDFPNGKGGTVIVVLGAMAAYPLARNITRWNKFMYTLFISALIVPPLTILVPLYKFFVDIGAMFAWD